MSQLLFPTDGPCCMPSSVKHKPTELPRQLFYIVRGATDAVEALELFLKLVSESPIAETNTTITGSGYLSFDAHVGDTACQLRACMLLEVTKLLKGPESDNIISTIRSTLCDLKFVTEGARQLLIGLLGLDWNKMRAGGLEAFNVPKAGMTTDELLVTLGWFGVRRSVFQYDNRSTSSSESLVSQDSPSSMIISLHGSDSGWSNRSTPKHGSETSNSDNEVDGVYWNPFDRRQLVRFVVYSYVLSKYKQLTSFGGVYRATLRPESAFEAGQKLIPQEFGRQFVRPNKRAIGDEFTSLQRYVSELSCAWLESQARKSRDLHPEYCSLLRSTIRTSAKGVSSTSSYVGYLVLRSLWAEDATPIIITTTRFCASGFHRNYFKSTPRIGCDKGLRHLESPTLPQISWQLSRLIGQDLEYLSRSLEPVIMVSGNSIDGTASDYYSRLPSAYAHGDDLCCDNLSHCDDMLASDQDRVIQSIFAEHRHYAFELSGGERVLGEDVVVQRYMDESIPGMSAMWARSRQEASLLGTGPSYKLYMWQHVALESPARFLARVEGSNRPWIISSAV